MDKKVFKILSVDGGGMKGLYSLKILERIEELYKCKLCDYFDLMCGTSTGGIIVLGLSSGISAKDISRFYLENGPLIFPAPHSKLGYQFQKVKQILFKSKYDNTKFRKALLKEFGDKKIQDCQNLLCIPAYSVTKGQPSVFKKDHVEGNLIRDNHLSIIDVALATSAAPTYLPMTEISSLFNSQYIDGGIWANNPSLCGYIEAMSYFVGTNRSFDHLKILSVSSLTKAFSRSIQTKKDRAFLDWKEDLFELFMNGQNYFANYFLQKIHDNPDFPVDYYRIPSEQISKEEDEHINFDLTTQKAIEVYLNKGDNMGLIYSHKSFIAEFFQEKKLYTF